MSKNPTLSKTKSKSSGGSQKKVAEVIERALAFPLDRVLRKYAIEFELPKPVLVLFSLAPVADVR